MTSPNDADYDAELWSALRDDVTRGDPHQDDAGQADARDAEWPRPTTDAELWAALRTEGTLPSIPIPVMPPTASMPIIPLGPDGKALPPAPEPAARPHRLGAPAPSAADFAAHLGPGGYAGAAQAGAVNPGSAHLGTGPFRSVAPDAAYPAPETSASSAPDARAAHAGAATVETPCPVRSGESADVAPANPAVPALAPAPPDADEPTLTALGLATSTTTRASGDTDVVESLHPAAAVDGLRPPTEVPSGGTVEVTPVVVDAPRPRRGPRQRPKLRVPDSTVPGVFPWRLSADPLGVDPRAGSAGATVSDLVQLGGDPGPVAPDAEEHGLAGDSAQ